MVKFDIPGAEDLARDEGWWRIYEISFPSRERETEEVILKSIVSGAGLAVRARLEKRTVGIATTHLLMDPPAVFLVYLAIAAEERSNGLGSPLLAYAVETSTVRLQEHGLNSLGVIFEVEPAPRRVAFFERYGAVRLAQRYFQPPVDGTGAVPMQLMFKPASGGAVPAPLTIGALIRAMYFEKYGAMNGVPAVLLDKLLRITRGS